jgi:hypothetical protein
MFGIKFYLGISLVALVSIFTLGSDRENINNFKRLYLKRFIREPFFALVTLGTFLFSGYIFTLDDTSENTHKLQRATRDALVAYIIALFAFFNLTLLPFWIIWFITYYSVL